MSLYAAIDLHSSNSVLAIIDETDRPVRQRRLPNDLPTILGELEPFRERVAGIAVESTYNWYWLVDGLMDHGNPLRSICHRRRVSAHRAKAHERDDGPPDDLRSDGIPDTRPG